MLEKQPKQKRAPFTGQALRQHFDIKETLNKARLTALHAICLQIFRHIAQKFLAIH
ncbi:MAG: hypothetical protein ACLR1R_02545 [Ruminococcus callidus]